MVVRSATPPKHPTRILKCDLCGTVDYEEITEWYITGNDEQHFCSVLCQEEFEMQNEQEEPNGVT